MIKTATILLVLVITSSLAFSQNANDVIGKWKTIDDETGEAKSIVELYKVGNKLQGKVIQILNPAKVDNVCTLCEDNRKGKRIQGMIIVKDMVWDVDEWDDGTILDPNKGSIYDCKLWLENDNKDKLYLRGYIGFLFRTQNWYRITE
ncbi:MAG: DUF2147 domain-containing protein [Salibacteraceae bacterium]|nr:DUF2147 domain-containing protein [Salibacteraceae bacterium]|tara:strand:- start:10912 stop:11352 length:441 start_codon:yes stop_codon:yes gene_type:complete